MKWHKWGILTLFVFLTLACGKEQPQPTVEFSILGKWQVGDLDKYFTFNDDNTMQTSVSGSKVFNGNYTWDGNKLTTNPVLDSYGNPTITESYTKQNDNTLKPDGQYEGGAVLIKR